MYAITDRFRVGQNIAQTFSLDVGQNDATLERLILLWYNEVNNFDNTKVEKYE